ncbi:hypothetical protein OS190_18010 [Sulfitobacter sp. F26204]|uniref:hypothetical protein n=1 Tax=Sulfitobacter sp. F26204 TaxID=2996014 RepID=UPI00225DD83D|nr:hypothetical protein [Sulfitobacter sp. F26204]MCX7561463.1 hypothetical protein [Sulfitobacter sp. F26204]
MYVKISKSGRVSLQDIDNFKAFSIRSELPKARWPDRVITMAIETEENHFWLNADTVLELSEKKDDEEWMDRFWKMLQAAEPYGFYDIKLQRIKAHVVYSDN